MHRVVMALGIASHINPLKSPRYGFNKEEPGELRIPVAESVHKSGQQSLGKPQDEGLASYFEQHLCTGDGTLSVF